MLTSDRGVVNRRVLVGGESFYKALDENFKADFYISSKNGFICASEQGNIAFLDLSGNYLGEINLNYFIQFLC